MAYYNCITWKIRKRQSPRFHCTSFTKRVLILFDTFSPYYSFMSGNIWILVSPRFQCTSITNRFLNLFDRLQAYYNCISWKFRKLLSPRYQCKNITNSVLSLFDRFTVIRIVWPEISENSNLRHFSAQVSQIVFSAYLTALPFITTAWVEISENSYLHHFSAQVSQIVFLANLTVLQAYYNCMRWNLRKLVSPRFHCRSITNRVLSLFDHFTAYYNCRKTQISAISMQTYHKSFS